MKKTTLVIGMLFLTMMGFSHSPVTVNNVNSICNYIDGNYIDLNGVHPLKNLIITPAQEDPPLANCTVRLFDADGFDYSDDWVDVGEGEYPNLDDIEGNNWTREADSFIVGEGTEVTMYPEVDFNGEGETYGPGRYDNDSEEPSSMKVVCKNLGVKKQVFMNFKFYPNPSQNQLSLTSSEPIERIKVYNLLGQQIMKAEPHTLETNISTAGLQTGLYLMEVSIDGSQKTFRIIKD